MNDMNGINRIYLLDPHVANLIAAGEVVERPASALKELLENAIDAGATTITAESAGGGARLLRVADNGCGMSHEDAERAFRRHATSKIRHAEDLHGVTTLGFRGEALAAVAAVSRIQLFTRVRGVAMGATLSLEAGRVTGRSEAGCPEGTTIVVRDLFFNTPARQKFLKRDQTETAHIQLACQRAALSHPEISFLYIRDGRQAFLTPGDGLPRSCLYSLFGREFTDGMCEVEHTQGYIRVWGFISRQEAALGSRNAQHVVVGGRPVRSRVVTAALEEAYKNRLTTGRYPACVLYIETPPVDCDVNIHPAKSEIRFSRERDIFDVVFCAARNALDQNARPLWEVDPSTLCVAQAQPPPGTKGTYPAGNWAADGGGDATPYTADPSNAASPYAGTPPYDDAPPYTGTSPNVAAPPPWRLVGEALGGYLIVETDEGLAIIDKHAAHERILFDRLKASPEKPMTQLLLSPLTVPLPSAEMSALLEHTDMLSATGFTAEEFGGGTLVVREVPSDVDLCDIPALLGEIAACLLEGRRDPTPRLFEDVLRRVACKAAVKLGRHARGSEAEAEALARQVMEDKDLRHCPHGRPVCVVLSRGMIEKQFRR
ncbi:MAG: DNA mismatch repair endonuclease MutL [Oscillospiraceae bacterium]|nr:DNA mismatch repair endonuclease MutL [Oscillospiraceae bacterium]